ncbi:hypothetical protein I3843_11G107400 [Carya illinoinensis]|nr:hypothetical protein I3843_11G107400 [Carya illinoinensis]
MHITRCIAIQHGVHSTYTPFLLRHTSLQHTSPDTSLHYTEYAPRVLSSHIMPYHNYGIHLMSTLHSTIHNSTIQAQHFTTTFRFTTTQRTPQLLITHSTIQSINYFKL